MEIQKILSDTRSSQANFGLTPKEFYKLVPIFQAELTKLVNKTKKQHREKSCLRLMKKN